MQYSIYGSRKNVTPEIAKAWFKTPDDFKPLALVNPKNIMTLNGHISPTLFKDGNRTLQLKTILQQGGFGKYKKELKPSIACEPGVGKPVLYNIDQLSGKLLPTTRLHFERVYDKLLLISTSLPVGLIPIADKEQWIRESDISKLGIVTYYGTRKYYASSTAWIESNEPAEWSEHERRYIIRDQSKQVIFGWDGETAGKRRVSDWEIARGEFGDIRQCRACNTYMLAQFESDGRRCPVCASGREQPRSTAPRGDIYNYTYKVEKDLGFDPKDCELIPHLTHPKTKPPMPVQLGIELEYNVKDGAMNTSAKFVNSTGYALCKSDSSIQASGQGNGYEIVTQPCSLKKHKEKLALILAKHGKDYIAGNSCGIHVHVSREPFTESDIAKALSFLHRGANRDFIQGMARRDSHRYARLTDTYIKQNKAGYKSGSSHKLLTNQDHNSPNRERYTALNVGTKTLEFRIFASSTDLDTIIASAQFCEAVCMYAKAHTTSTKYSKLSVMKWLNIASFIEFLKDSQVKTMVKPATDKEGPVWETKQKYPELEAFIIANKLPTVSKNDSEVLYTKVYTSIIQNVLPVYKHREIPVSVAEAIAKELLTDKTTMLRWLHEVTDSRGGVASFNEESEVWELRASTKEVLWKYNQVNSKVA